MCLRRGVTVVILALGLSAGGGVALADHCGPADKDHLGDSAGSCGYVVQPVQPSPQPGITPTPWPVSVENVPTIKVRPEAGADPIPVEITNPATTDPTIGWTTSDREMLADLLVEVQNLRLMLVWVGGLVLFVLGLVAVFVIPRGR